MKTSICLVLLAMIAGCADSTLTVENETSFTFTEIDLAPVDSTTWGANLLRGDVLMPNEQLQIDLISCDNYDVRIVSDAGHDCVLNDLNLCFDNTHWVLDNTELAACSF